MKISRYLLIAGLLGFSGVSLAAHHRSSEMMSCKDFHFQAFKQAAEQKAKINWNSKSCRAYVSKVHLPQTYNKHQLHIAKALMVVIYDNYQPTLVCLPNMPKHSGGMIQCYN